MLFAALATWLWPGYFILFPLLVSSKLCKWWIDAVPPVDISAERRAWNLTVPLEERIDRMIHGYWEREAERRWRKSPAYKRAWWRAALAHGCAAVLALPVVAVFWAGSVGWVAVTERWDRIISRPYRVWALYWLVGALLFGLASKLARRRARGHGFE